MQLGQGKTDLIALSDIPPEVAEALPGTYTLAELGEGCTSDIALVHGTDEKLVLKCSRRDPFRQWLQREYEVLTALTETDLPVPRPHRFVVDDAHYTSWLIMDLKPGQQVEEILPGIDGSKRKHVFSILGKTLRRLHQCPIPSGLRRQSSTDWLDARLCEAESNLRNYEVSGNEALLTRLKADRPEAIPARLIHGDLNLENVLVTDEGEVSIIDWSGGALGDPRYDIAVLLNKNAIPDLSESDHQAFFRGYGTEPVSQDGLRYFVGLYEFF